MSAPGITTLGSSHISNPDPVSHPANNLAGNNAFYKYFGATKPGTEVTPYDATNRSTWLLPEGLLGNNRYLGHTMRVVAAANNAAILQVFLPIVRADGALSSSWSRWEFPTQLPDVVPERGVVRLVRANRISGGESMVRYGLGLFLEHGFMNTPLGRKHYMMNLKQVNQSVSEGLQFQGLYAIATAEDWSKRFLQEHSSLNPYSGKQMMDVMKRELTLWAYLQQNRNAWVQLDALITAANDFYNHGTRLTHYLTDSRVAHFRKAIPQDRVEYMLSGRKSPLTHDGVESRSVDEMGNIIYTTRSYLADADGPITPMQQPTQIGEFFVSRDLNSGTNRRNVDSTDRDVHYYDESGDCMNVITLAQKLKHCNRFRPDGRLWSFDDPEAMRHSIAGYSKEELSADFLHYLDNDGKLKPVSFFGNINQPHLRLQDYEDMANSVVYRLQEATSRSHGSISKIFAEGRRAVAKMAAERFSQEYNALWRALARKNANKGLEVTGGRALPDALRANQWKSNSHGSLDLPVRGELSKVIATVVGSDVTVAAAALTDTALAATVQSELAIAIARAQSSPGEAISIRAQIGTYSPGTLTVTATANGQSIYQSDAVAGYAGRFQLPPTHLTWGGLRTIADAYDSGRIEAMGFNRASAKAVRDFVLLASEVVEALALYFPNSIFLSADYANPWTPTPSSQDTFFESLFLQGIPTIPAFLRAPANVKAELEKQSVPLRAQSADTAILDAVEDAFATSTSARNFLQTSTIGSMVRDDEPGVDEPIGARFGAADGADPDLKFALRQIVDKQVSTDTCNEFVLKRYAGAAQNDKPVQLDDDSTTFNATYNKLVRWTMLVRPTPTTGTTAPEVAQVVNGAAGTAMVLATLMLTARSEDAETTMQNYADVLAKVEQAVALNPTGTTVTSSNVAFSQAGALGRYAQTVLEMFEARPDLLAGGVEQMGRVQQLFQGIGDDATNFDVASLASGGAGDRVQVDAVQRLASLQGSGEQSFFRAPIVLSPAALQTFATYAASTVSAGEDLTTSAVYGWPSSPDNSLVRVGAGELLNSLAEARHVGRVQAARSIAGAQSSGGQASMASEIQPVYLNNEAAVAQELSHNSVLRKAYHMQASKEFADPMPERRAPVDAGFSSSARSRILGAVDIGAAYGQPVDGNATFAELQSKRFDNVDAAAVRDEDARVFSMDRGTKRARGDPTGIRDTMAYTRNTGLSTAESVFDGSSRGRHLNEPKEAAAGSGDYGVTPVNAFLAKHMSRNFAVLYAQISANLKGLYRIAALAFLGTPVTRQAMEATIKHNLMHPFNYLCVRAHADYDGLTVTKMKPGIETGRTNLGEIKVEMGDDADTGVHHANITYYSNSEITDPKNIYNARNVLIVAYNGGLSSGFYDRDNYSPTNKNYGRRDDSFHILAVSRNEVPNANPISLTGRYDWVDNEIYNLHPGSFSALTYMTAPYYNGWWGWSGQKFGTALDYSMFEKYRTERSVPNCLAFQSYAGYWSSQAQACTRYTNQTGHWKIQSVGAGMAQARIGLCAMDNSPIQSRLGAMSQVAK